MNPADQALPVVRPLPRGFSLEQAFVRLATRPGCLWLDSASRGPRLSNTRLSTTHESNTRESKTGLSETGETQNGETRANGTDRYSFLTADPIDTLVASVEDCDPWPTLDAWCQNLPREVDDSLPPFQGGIAGLIGYEAATWLEPVGMARSNDLPTPAISLGLYDWTIAMDHETGRAWIISQGLGAADVADRHRVAASRADDVEALLTGRSPASEPNLAPSDGDYDAMLGDDQFPTPLQDVRSNFTSDQFRARVAEIVRMIRDGDSFQVNLAQRLLKPAHLGSPELYMRLRTANPAPFGAYYRGPGFDVLSSSPEGFLKLRGGRVETRPIKGTVRRTGEPSEDARLADELASSQKDLAENVMIVDLMRNDLSRVCEDESVQVQQLCKVERYQYVQHLVSVVEGRLRQGKTAVDLLRACFPGGSVTGAPKIEAMRSIARLEPNPRGPYCGSIGYISCGGDADFNILIRTITAAHGYWQIPVGGGITARSDPAEEEAETWAKAEGMLRAIADD